MMLAVFVSNKVKRCREKKNQAQLPCRPTQMNATYYIKIHHMVMPAMGHREMKNPGFRTPSSFQALLNSTPFVRRKWY
jgi:hypothetical protein